MNTLVVFSLLLSIVVAQNTTAIGLYEPVEDFCIRFSCDEGESMVDGCIPIPSSYLPTYFQTANLQIGLAPNNQFMIRLIINAYQHCKMPLLYLDMISIDPLNRTSLLFDNGTHIEGHITNMRATPVLQNLTRHLDLDCSTSFEFNETINVKESTCYYNYGSAPVNLFTIFSIFYDFLIQFDYQVYDPQHLNITYILIPLIQNLNENFTIFMKLNSTYGSEGYGITSPDGILTATASLLLVVVCSCVLLFL